MTKELSSFHCDSVSVVTDLARRTRAAQLSVATEDWDAAPHAYARDHERYYGLTHKVDGFDELLHTNEPQAATRRQRALSLMAEVPMRIPDHVMYGRDLRADETVRRHFFGEN